MTRLDRYERAERVRAIVQALYCRRKRAAVLAALDRSRRQKPHDHAEHETLSKLACIWEYRQATARAAADVIRCGGTP